MNFKRLLAKGAENPRDPPTEATLLGHTERVVEAATVFSEILALEMERLLEGAGVAGLWAQALQWAAWLHDLGKANDHFQRMVREKRAAQGVRHEVLGLVVAHDVLWEWLSAGWLTCPAWFPAAVLAAVSGHHLKFPDAKKRQGMEVRFLGAHPDLAAHLAFGARHFALPEPPTLADRAFSLDSFEGVNARAAEIRRTLDTAELRQEKLFVACLKAALLCADTAGSAVPADKPLGEWLRERLAVTLTREGLEEVVQQRLQGQKPRPFQEAVRHAESATVLLTAGCGSGKTAAAYLWAAERAQGRRLFVCYPTTATASEGFAGYLHDPDFEAVLIHSRSRVDYRLLENMPEPTKSERELRALQLEAIETWPIPAAVCTAHTVLGLLQNVRRGLYAWPAIARAAFVFDEVHAYSPKLFRHLLHFLEIFLTAPVLLMTATLPKERRRALEATCAGRGALVEVRGPEERETAIRYTLVPATEEEAWAAASREVRAGGKVLWVCNTVARAVTAARRGLEECLPVQPYHSRYRYRDRLARQRCVVDGFRPETPGLLAITTQVAEVSLDLSADLLVSELAPVPSLIQRLGRLNRRDDIPSGAMPALLVRPENAQPYAKQEGEERHWTRIDAWLAQVADAGPRSQRDLAEAFLQLPEEDEDGTEDFRCHWIADPWLSEANKEPLMEPGYTIEMVREEDLGDGVLAELAIPMPFPKGRAWERWPSQGRYLVAPIGTIHYDPLWGASYGRQELDPWII
ncbi:MAG: CRISPR-associated helicase Cas3' [Deltaproteobacteria bacterium]|nr:CRISPR-associated helicase Cas3' [Deltaproteobacteria bacterium]